MIVAGKLGLNIACQSFCNSFNVTVTADVLVFQETEKLATMIKRAISDEIEKHGITIETYDEIYKDDPNKLVDLRQFSNQIDEVDEDDEPKKEK